MKGAAILIQTILESGDRQTRIIVSHRMSVLSKADHIIVLEDGRIVESGAHSTLVDGCILPEFFLRTVDLRKEKTNCFLLNMF